MDTGLLILRLVVGLLVAGHGAQKMFGWFGGPGQHRTKGMFAQLGYHPPHVFAFVGAGVELVAGVFLAAGFLIPLAAAMIIGQMLNAAWTVHRSGGLWVTNNGVEYNVVLAAVAAALAFTGAGRYSLDNAAGLHFGSDWWGVAAVLVGLLVGVLTLAVRRPPAAEHTTAEQQHAPAA